MPGSAFDDHTVTLEGAPDQMATFGLVFSSRTRIAVLQTLMRSPTPLHINEVARRVGVDASPVRTHLELLVKAGIVREVVGEVGRERRFETRLTDARLTLEGVNRPVTPDKAKAPPKSVVRLEKKLAALAREMARLEEVGRKLHAEMAEAWAEADPAPPRG